jgi:hypothetical protein
VRTSSIDRPKAASRSVSTTTFMARVRPPTRLTAPTPWTVSSRSLICLRAISVTSRKSRRPETAIVSTGEASRSNLSTSGVSVPSGRVWRIELILSRTSWAPTSPFLESSNCTVTTETPLLGRRPQFLDAADRVDDVLDRLGDRGLHLFDAGPRQHGGDRGDGEVDAGEQVHAQAAVGDPTQHDRDGHQHPGEDGPANADLGNVHGSPGDAVDEGTGGRGQSTG